MTAPRSEKETDAVSAARAADTQTYPLPQLTFGAKYAGDADTDPPNISMGYRVAEAACVTLGVGILAVVTRFLWTVVASRLPASMVVGSGLAFWLGGMSFVLSAVTCCLIGGTAGLLANRRTTATSLVIANVVSTVGWQTICILMLPKQFASNASFTVVWLAQPLLGAVTITVAEIVIAQYMARKRGIATA